MKVLLLGSGGREHALAWSLRHSPRVQRLYALPGSDAIATLAEPVAGDPCDPAQVVEAAERLQPDLTVVGPEAPLAAGVSDALRARGYAIFGPSQAAARLESSKIYAKEFMQRHGIATARAVACDSAAEALRALAEFGAPVVIKADGLAAGKGVVVAEDQAEAERAAAAMFAGQLGAAGRRVLVEERLRGEEVSVLALSDGERFELLPPAQDHKRARNGDTGPNTGGMGAYSIDELLTAEQRAAVAEQVVRPVLEGMRAEGEPFQGVLYCGLMLTAAGPRVLEFNARFGDPETQALLLRAEGDLAAALAAAAGGQLAAGTLRWTAEAGACVVLASAGYPGEYPKGLPIHGLEQAAREPGVVLFHAGTALRQQQWVTNGGRVLGIAARGSSLALALERCYAAAEEIRFEGKHYRSDIGRARVATASRL
ncbi:MAG: phosphoribosylamine--glycine ligase [Terriglobales bacterium]